jgi:flagellar secretion chaperone FliS
MAAQHSQYLESKVLTAPPHRLHLMLIEGAIRFGRQAEEAIGAGNAAAASAPLLRVLDIVGEMLAAVRDRKSELNTKLAELYWFIFRRVTEAKIQGDAVALTEVLSILEYERQTWQLVCEKFSGSQQRVDAGGSISRPTQGPTDRATAPHAGKQGLSLEA